MSSQRKVPAGPKAVPGGKGGSSASSTRKQTAVGISPSDLKYGISNTSRKHKSAVSSASRNTPSGQGVLASKAKRQVG